MTSATYSSGVAALGDHVRAEEGGLVGEQPGDRQAARLVADRQPVAALDLDRGRALSPHLGDQRGDPAGELLVGGGPGGGDGGADAAGGVRRPGHPGGELRRAVAREDQVGVGVHEAGDDGAATGVDVDVGRRGVGGGPGPRDPVALEDDGGVGDDAEEVVGLRVVGDQLADVGDDGASRPESPDRVVELAADVVLVAPGEDDLAVRDRPGRRRRRVAAKTAVCSSRPVPAVRGVVVSRVTRSARCADGDAPASSYPRLAWPSTVAARRSSAGRPVPALAGGEALVELDRPHLLEQVDDGVAVGAEGQRAARVVEALGSGRCRRRGRARWWGRSRRRYGWRRGGRCRRRSGGWRARRWSAGRARRGRRAAGWGWRRTPRRRRRSPRSARRGGRGGACPRRPPRSCGAGRRARRGRSGWRRRRPRGPARARPTRRRCRR